MNISDYIATHYREIFGQMLARLTRAGFVQALGKGYEAGTGLHAEIYITRAASSAELLR